ncbi:MAG: glutathione S-transferase family protein, partial [Trichodesmium sp. St18_bin3_1_1]|nr:glutathione S-transferase family protein [Trichodesmium sp. St18_bin3_1_1]
MVNKRRSLPPSLTIKLGKWVWTTLWQTMMSKLAPRNNSGEYIRPASLFRQTVGIQPENKYQPATKRYRLFVGLGCPWAHRTIVVRALKGLEDAISVTIASPAGDKGVWVFEEEEEGCNTLPELYNLAQPGYNGRATVPVLWDEQTKTIVNNESADIIVILNTEFNHFAKNSNLDLYPEQLKAKIDQWNEKIYHTVNNGVYRCGFAQSQEAYEKACQKLFTTLDEIDNMLSTSR